MRCGREFTRTAVVGPQLNDAGPELDSLGVSPAALFTDEYSGSDDDQLAAIAAKLKPRRRTDAGVATTAPFRWASSLGDLGVPPRSPASPPVVRQAPAWGVATLLWGGGAVFVLGVLKMGDGAAYDRVAAWQWGVACALFGQGLLVIGLALAALRLWNHSRQLHRQLEGVGAQINEVGHLAGQIAHARMHASHAYYEHFGGGVSPPLAIANLRGQLEQIAARIDA